MTSISNILYLHETSKMAGAENSLLQLAVNLDRGRFCPIFALPKDGPLSIELGRLNVAVHSMPYPKIRYGIGVLSTIMNLKNFIQKENIALIHSNSIRTHIYGAIVGRILKLPVVWHERNLLIVEKIDPDRVLAFLPDAVICNSNAVARRFECKGKMPAKVSVIHNGVDLGAFNPSIGGEETRKRFNIGSEDIVIGMVARLNANKGHETFFRAAQLLACKMPDMAEKMRFLIVGGAIFDEDAKYEDHLKRIAGDMTISKKIVFTGVCADMPKIYAAMDIAVLASEVEACSRAVSEAMSMGRPVVATNTGGTPELVVDDVTGVLVPFGVPEAMADALGSLVSDKTKRFSMGSAGRQRAEELFDIKRSARKIETIYSSLLAKKGAI